MPDILAIVSKSIFERDAYIDGTLARPGAVWPTDRYFSGHRSFNALEEGGRIFLVTVRPPGEQLWLVGVIDTPKLDVETGAWIGRGQNTYPVTDITALRSRILFESGKGLSQNEGALAMSLQTPRALAAASAADIIAVTGGVRLPAPRPKTPEEEAAMPAPPETHEERVVREGREAKLQEEVDRFIVLFDKMQEVYGLRLPESLAYAVGFVSGLSEAERAEFSTHVGKLVGVGAWFSETEKSGFSGDERLRDRLTTDPPELVPVLETPTGERWGLWYDDSDELPTGIARRVKSEEAPGWETMLWQTTLLQAFRHRVSNSGSELPNRIPILTWLDAVGRIEASNVRERSPIPLQRGGYVVGERMNPYFSDLDLPLDLVGQLAQDGRRAAYASDAPVVEEWIERAKSELRDAVPMRALFIGRELHGFQRPQWRMACTELLIRAYSLAGRHPLADVVRAVYRGADPDKPIYELPPPHPLKHAALKGDVDDILEALRGEVQGSEAPTTDDLEEALAAAHTPTALGALLEHVPADQSKVTDTALWRRLQMLFRSRRAAEIAHHRALVVLLVERGHVSARAFDRILGRGEEELIKRASARVDLESTLSNGATPLHLAARHAIPGAVKTLLDRGMDPRTKNADGRMAYDGAREAQVDNPSDPRATEILQLLQVAGGGMAKPALPASDEVEYCEGDAVHHKKLGDGIVESVTGEGEEAKLKIRFESETKTFLAKFVTPKTS